MTLVKHGAVCPAPAGPARLAGAAPFVSAIRTGGQPSFTALVHSGVLSCLRASCIHVMHCCIGLSQTLEPLDGLVNLV
jgi:hypothetical protein